MDLKDYQVAEFKNYNTLIPLVQTALKPIFELTAKDGVVGGHNTYVRQAKDDFDHIASSFISMI